MQSGSTPQVNDYFASLQTPDTSDMELQLKQLVQQGVLTPEDAQAALVGDSAMNGITLDPALKEKQMASLQALQDLADGGGMTLTDQANLSKIQNQINTQSRGAREAILQNAQQRGLGGSGLELMSQMQNQQDAATRASQGGLDVAAQARDRALEAMIQGGQMAGDVRNQDFNQKAQVAGAQDAISKFNAQNQQQINMANTAAHNNAQATNLQNKQDIANQNVGLQNTQQQYNNNLIQQNYDNEIKKRSGQAGIAQNNAANAGRDNQNQANANNQLIGGLIGAGSSFLGRK